MVIFCVVYSVFVVDLFMVWSSWDYEYFYRRWLVFRGAKSDVFLFTEKAFGRED
jgi:hypothetical protein